MSEELNSWRNMYNTGKTSTKWKHWISQIDLKTCESCRKMHGKIYSVGATALPSPPLHLFCRCAIKLMKAMTAGTCSQLGKDGADWRISTEGELPENYITKEELTILGWKRGKSPDQYAPGRIVTGGEYANYNEHLPAAPGRICFEADLNYTTGKRNGHRILWSNDGLMFVTYNHYETFIEVIGG